MSAQLVWLCICGLPTMNGPRGRCAQCARDEAPPEPTREPDDDERPFAFDDSDTSDPLIPAARNRAAVRGGSRGLTISIKRLSKRALEHGRLRYPDVDVPRPETRADCVQGVNAERPCPFVSCKYHLYLDVSPRSGAIKLNFPHLEVHELDETCGLDVAERGGATLEEVGLLTNLTRERIRQLETRGLAKLKALDEIARAAELAGVRDTRLQVVEPEETRDRASFAEDCDAFTHHGPTDTAFCWAPGGPL